MQSPLSIALLAVRTIDSAFHDSGIDRHVTKPLDPLFCRRSRSVSSKDGAHRRDKHRRSRSMLVKLRFLEMRQTSIRSTGRACRAGVPATRRVHQPRRLARGADRAGAVDRRARGSGFLAARIVLAVAASGPCVASGGDVGPDDRGRVAFFLALRVPLPAGTAAGR
jgi:hypothetical protein